MAVRTRLRLFVALGLPALVVASLLARDLTRPPDRQVTAHLAVSAIRWYHTTLSPHLPTRCRFKPSCSQYAIAVIERHGLLGGSWRAAWRIARCGPWTPAGTIDLPE
jgi:uncharacterized protein